MIISKKYNEMVIIMYHFIVNPKSKSGRGQLIWNMVEKKLIRLSVSYDVIMTSCVGHARQAAEELSSQSEAVTIVVIGGDGTINEVLSGLHLSGHVVLGCIPTGSGNDFAKGMHLPTTPMEALDNILYGRNTLSIDLGRIEANGRTSRFGVSAGMGFDASICHEALSSPIKQTLNKLHLGRLTYFLVALKQIFLYTPSTITLTMDGGRTFTYKKAFFAAAFNQPCEGGGIRICPNARPDDEELDVCIVSDVSRFKVALFLPSAFLGLHTHIKGVHFMRCKTLTVQSDRPLPVHRDGESGGNQKNITISLEKTTLKVIVPVI